MATQETEQTNETVEPQRRYDAGSWETWDAFAWSEFLLDWFFVRAEHDGPISQLDVSDAGLARSVGLPVRRGDEVKNRLIEVAVRASKGDLWAHAERKGPNPNNWFLFLVVSVIAAVDTEHPGERSYIDRLAELDPRAETHLEKLPGLWERLQGWLEADGTHRDLALPDPGSYTRVGYSIRLAFPTRRDLIRLSCVFDDNGLTEDAALSAIMPPVRAMTDLGPAIEEALEEFDILYDADASAEELHATKFWGAVIDAFETPTLVSEGSFKARWAIVGGLVTDEPPVLDLVTDTEVAPLGFDLQPEPGLKEWPYCVLSALEDPIEALLNQRLTGLGRLDRLVDEGVVPMAKADHDERESVSRLMLDEADAALVRNDLAEVIMDSIGTSATRSTLLPGTDWSFVSGLAAGSWGRLEAAAGELGIAILQAAPRPRQIRVVGGLRVNRGRYMKLPGQPLEIRAQWAVGCRSRVDGGSWEELIPADQGWTLQVESGSVEIEAYSSSGAKKRVLRLVGFVPRSEPKQVTDDASYWTLGAGGSVDLRTLPANSVPEIVAAVDRVSYLSADVGLYCAGPEGAAWELEEFAGAVHGRSMGRPVEPTARSESGGDRRRWRQFLGRAVIDDDDGGLAERGGILNGARLDKMLPVRESSSVDHGLVKHTTADPHRGVATLESAVVALGNAKIGLSQSEFGELATSCFGLNFEDTWVVQLDWVEAGLLRPLISKRWTRRLLVARPPTFHIFETDRWHAAALAGLSTNAMRVDATRIAVELGLLCEAVPAVSPYVPPTLAFRSRERGSIELLASRLRVPSSPVLRPSSLLEGVVDVLDRPPGEYSEQGGEFEFTEAPGVALQFMKRNDAPAFWTLRSGPRSMWTYNRNAARFWARALSGLPVVEINGAQLTAAAPLPLANVLWLGELGSPRPGSDSDVRRYPTHTAELAAKVAEEIQLQVAAALETIEERSLKGVNS